MADLVIGIDANGDGAAHTFRSLGEEVLNFAEKIGELTKEFRDHEKAQVQVDAAIKQLGYDVGKLSPALREQAQAFQDNLGVSKDMVAHMQSLMLTFGTAPEDIGKTTQAILDYAARTGQDASAATLKLEKAIDNGGKGLAKMGIHFVETGDKAKDLQEVVEQLEGRMGGAAAAAADTLEGRLNKLQFSVNDLKEEFGHFIADVDSKYHVIETLTEALKSAREALVGKAAPTAADQLASYKHALKTTEDQLDEMEARFIHLQELGFHITQKQFDEETEKLKEIARLKAAIAAAPLDDLAGVKGKGKTGYETKGDKKEEIDEEKEVAKARRDSYAEYEKIHHNREELDRQNMERAKKIRAAVAEDTKEELRLKKEAEKAEHYIRDEEYADEVKFRKEMAKLGEEAVKVGIHSLIELAKGHEVAWADILSSFMEMMAARAVVEVAAALAAENYWGAAKWGIVAGMATAGAMGIGAAGNSGAKHHDGGWAGDERPKYHTGGFVEVPATLLAGERVLSHAEIDRMGGPNAVDSAARGGGQPLIGQVNVQALDAAGIRDLFMDQGGRGLSQAVRTGRGYTTRLFGRR